MEEEASSVPPGSGGVIGIFSNLMNAKKWVHASPSFLQFDITNPAESGKRECIRAIEEAAAYAAFGHLKIIGEINKSKPREVLFAGGASKGFLWPQLLSDILGTTVHVPVVKESTALGAAICAGVGAGFHASISKGAEKLSLIEKSFEPRQNIRRQYRELYKNWIAVYDGNLKISEAGLLKPLWRAAGT